jgi:hypothetical protein
MGGVDWASLVVTIDAVAHLAQEHFEFLPAAMDVTDDIEWTTAVAEVGQQLLSHNDGVSDVLLAIEHVDLAEALLAQIPQRAP